MIYCTCPKCQKRIIVDECDTTPGCREREEVYCPNPECDNENPITSCFTSGIPIARLE